MSEELELAAGGDAEFEDDGDGKNGSKIAYFVYLLFSRTVGVSKLKESVKRRKGRGFGNGKNQFL